MALAVLAVALGLRWPLRGIALEEFDSANFAMGIERLDLERHHPHPPGYILFIWVARLALVFAGDPVRAMTSVSALSGALSAALVFVLLRTALPRRVALTGTVLYALGAQVWLQHVRPLSDAFAALWLLLAALALVRARDGDRKAFVLGAFLTGLACGAKQLLVVFLSGALLAAVVPQLKRRRLPTVALGVLAGLAGVAVWLVPLAVHSGSLHRYLALSAEQAAFQETEGLLFDPIPPRVDAFVQYVLVSPWVHRPLVVPMWSLVVIGAAWVLAARSRPRWLLWLALPGFLCHALLLGPTPRYALHYMPFLCGLAACGFDALLRRVGAAVAPAGSMPRLLVAGNAVLAVAWSAVQAERALPTLRVLASEGLPIVAALEHVRAHGDPRTTLVLVQDVQLGRQLEYYAPRYGLRFAHVDAVTDDDVRGRDDLVLLQSGIRPRVPRAFHVEARLLGQWARQPPSWQIYSAQLNIWRVVLFELVGPYVSCPDFGLEEPEREASALLAAGRGGRIFVYGAPPTGFRLLADAVTTPACAGARASVSVNKQRSVPWDGTSALAVDVWPAEVQRPRVRLDLRLEPGPTYRGEACVRISRMTVEAPRGVQVTRELGPRVAHE